MVKFNTAIKWMRAGKKVKRPSWMKGSYLTLGVNESILYRGFMNAHIHLNQIEADDWEIYKEPKQEYWTCSKCEKKYKTYLVIFNDNVLSIASELEIREKYYNQKLRKGLCEACSKKIRK